MNVVFISMPFATDNVLLKARLIVTSVTTGPALLDFTGTDLGIKEG